MEYITENRFKFMLGGILFACVFALGAYARPGIDQVAGIFVTEQKTYVAPKTDNEIAVEKYVNSTDFKAECFAIAQSRVMLKVSGEALEASKIAQTKVEQYEMRALNGISNETATATITLEKAQGRR